jgi:YHS domain-containing protein
MDTTKTLYAKEEARLMRFFKIVFVVLVIVLALFTALLANGQQYKGHYLNNVDANGIILDGYDPVAFFTDNKPVKGDPNYEYTYQEAKYHFASQEHLDLFKSNPEKYKPQFGAWCAYAVSLGRTAPIDVNTFSIVNGRLVIQHNQKAVNGWEKDPKGNLKLADKYWPAVTGNGGKQIKTEEGKGLLGWILGGIAAAIIISFLVIRGRQKNLKSKMVATSNYYKMADSKM